MWSTDSVKTGVATFPFSKTGSSAKMQPVIK